MKNLILLTVLSSLSLTTSLSKNARYVAYKPHLNTIGAGSQTLRILNMEDYIYEQDIDEGYEDPDLVEQFKEYASGLGYENVEVIYDTTDTNETLYSELQTGKAFYDIICPSDYMIQKLISDDLLYKFSNEDKEMMPNYFGDNAYVSTELYNRLGNIMASNGEYLRDYAVGYMWGTLGILFDPEYKGFDFDLIDDPIDPIFDMQYWDTLWDYRYKGTISIKDSMRDTYAAGIMYTYEDDLIAIKNKLDQDNDIEFYKTSLEEIFNRCNPSQVEEVRQSLEKLKENVFGFEVDSGKQDIVTGKIGINFAWSGDAVYSMDQAEDPEQVSEPFELYYSIPELGSNIWFDAWVMPSCQRSQAQKELALLFLNFISDPANAKQNMDYTGYTSFIAGNDILDLVNDWYGTEEEDVNNAIPVDLTYFFDGTVDQEYYDEDGRIIVYTDEYYAEEGNASVGRQFFCQYPDLETINRCAVMRDYGENNAIVMKMWERFKSNTLPLWANILFISEIVIIVGGVGMFFFNRKISHSLRKKRKENK